MTYPWTKAGCEPSIIDLLSDPIAGALMRSDGIHVSDVLAIVDRIPRRNHARFHAGAPGDREEPGCLARATMIPPSAPGALSNRSLSA
jgi:hypothetical protein